MRWTRERWGACRTMRWPANGEEPAGPCAGPGRWGACRTMRWTRERWGACRTMRWTRERWGACRTMRWTRERWGACRTMRWTRERWGACRTMRWTRERWGACRNLRWTRERWGACRTMRWTCDSEEGRMPPADVDGRLNELHRTPGLESWNSWWQATTGCCSGWHHGVVIGRVRGAGCFVWDSCSFGRRRGAGAGTAAEFREQFFLFSKEMTLSSLASSASDCCWDSMMPSTCHKSSS